MAKTMRMRTAKPKRQSARPVVAADGLKARLLELCNLAEASIAALRALDLEVATPEDFSAAVDGLTDAGFYVQGFPEALKARVAIRKAAEALRFVDIEDQTEAYGPGLTKIMMADARSRLAAAVAA